MNPVSNISINTFKVERQSDDEDSRENKRQRTSLEGFVPIYTQVPEEQNDPMDVDQTDFIGNLPGELKSKLLQILDLKSLARFGKTSTKNNKIASESQSLVILGAAKSHAAGKQKKVAAVLSGIAKLEIGVKLFDAAETTLKGIPQLEDRLKITLKLANALYKQGELAHENHKLRFFTKASELMKSVHGEVHSGYECHSVLSLMERILVQWGDFEGVETLRKSFGITSRPEIVEDYLSKGLSSEAGQAFSRKMSGKTKSEMLKTYSQKLLSNDNIEEVIDFANKVGPDCVNSVIGPVVEYLVELGDPDWALDRAKKMVEQSYGCTKSKAIALVAKDKFKKGEEQSGRDLFELAKRNLTIQCPDQLREIAIMESECGLFKEAKATISPLLSFHIKFQTYLKIAQNEGDVNLENAKKTIGSAKSAIKAVRDLEKVISGMVEIWDTQMKWSDLTGMNVTKDQIISRLTQNLLEEIKKTQIECGEDLDFEAVKNSLKEIVLVDKEHMKMLFNQSKAFIKIAKVHLKILGDHEMFFEISNLAIVISEKIGKEVPQHKDAILREIALALGKSGYLLMAFMKAEEIGDSYEKIRSLLEIHKAFSKIKT